VIYYTPTEATERSRVPGALLSIAKPAPGLERMTGADFLITPHDNKKLPPLTGSVVSRAALRLHCRDGILIQRKSGGDLLSSIRELPEFLARMQEWQDSPWLVVTGISKGKHDRVKVFGKVRTRWKWQHVSGALDAWQDRGGCIKMLDLDADLTDWFRMRERRCREWLKTPVRDVIKASRQMVHRVNDNWYTTGAAWPPGIGPKMLASLAWYISEVWEMAPTLANAISLAASDEVLKVRGWGKKSLAAVRQWYGVTTSNPSKRLGVPSGCWIYDWDEGALVVVESGELARVEQHDLGTLDNYEPVPKDAVVVDIPPVESTLSDIDSLKGEIDATLDQ